MYGKVDKIYSDCNYVELNDNNKNTFSTRFDLVVAVDDTNFR